MYLYLLTTLWGNPFVFRGFRSELSLAVQKLSLVPGPHPPGEEKGLVTIRHPARPSDVAVWHVK